MEDNLAHELEFDQTQLAVEEEYYEQVAQPVEEAVPSIEPIPQAEPISKGLAKGEVILMAAMGIIVFALILFNVHSSLSLADASRSVQDVNNQIAQTEVEIENLNQHVHELSRYDRVAEIAQKHGLELYEENIINLAPQE
jgi:cell division protein FtsL